MPEPTKMPHDLTGPVSAEEAHKIAQRFIDKAFNNKDKPWPEFTIPRDPSRDDDIRLDAYIDQSAARIATLESENAELRGVVEKLPVTADGVRVVPDQVREVWWWDGNVLLVGGVGMETELLFADPNDPTVMFTPNCGVSGCYSTREAAEKARGQ